MSDKTASGAAHIVKTKRVTHTVTQADIDAAIFHIDAPWDTPFADTNYTADTNVETTGGVLPEFYAVFGFTKAVDKLTSAIVSTGGSVGDVIVLHAFAIHD